MVESKGITSKYSLLSSMRIIDIEDLYDYALKYLKKHTYISSKNLTSAYLYDYYNLTYSSMDYRKIRRLLSHKFGNIMSRFLREKRIFGYSPKLYKRVDIVQSLCVDTPKIDLDIKKTPGKKSVSHLVFDGISFKNPRLGF